MEVSDQRWSFRKSFPLRFHSEQSHAEGFILSSRGVGGALRRQSGKSMNKEVWGGGGQCKCSPPAIPRCHSGSSRSVLSSSETKEDKMNKQILTKPPRILCELRDFWRKSSDSTAEHWPIQTQIQENSEVFSKICDFLLA